MTLAEILEEIELAHMNLYEAELNGGTPARLAVLRARVRQAEGYTEEPLQTHEATHPAH